MFQKTIKESFFQIFWESFVNTTGNTDFADFGWGPTYTRSCALQKMPEYFVLQLHFWTTRITIIFLNPFWEMAYLQLMVCRTFYS